MLLDYIESKDYMIDLNYIVNNFQSFDLILGLFFFIRFDVFFEKSCFLQMRNLKFRSIL